MQTNLKTCLHCGDPISASTTRPRQFCSDAHRKAYSRRRDNGQNLPEPYLRPLSPNHDSQVIDIVDVVCPLSRTPYPRLEEGEQRHLEIDPAGGSWRGSWTSAMTAGLHAAATGDLHLRLGNAKSLAYQMARDISAGQTCDDWILRLNRQAAAEADASYTDAEAPRAKPRHAEGLPRALMPRR